MYPRSNRTNGGFTLVEIMIVVAIIALLAALAVPNFLRARKRSQSTKILQDLRMINAAMDQYALEYSKSGTATIDWDDIQLYLKPATKLYSSGGADLYGNMISWTTLDSTPKLNVDSYNSLSDVVPPEFWSPFYP